MSSSAIVVDVVVVGDGRDVGSDFVWSYIITIIIISHLTVDAAVVS